MFRGLTNWEDTTGHNLDMLVGLTSLLALVNFSKLPNLSLVGDISRFFSNSNRTFTVDKLGAVGDPPEGAPNEREEAAEEKDNAWPALLALLPKQS